MGTHANTQYEPPQTALEPLLDVEGTSAFLSVSRRQTYLLVERGELPAVRVGTRLRFIPEELRAYLERRREAGP
jgi:excisionase family DNA binding protein